MRKIFLFITLLFSLNIVAQDDLMGSFSLKYKGDSYQQSSGSTRKKNNGTTNRSSNDQNRNSGNPFPKGKKFYFTNGDHSTCVMASFGIDDDQDRYCVITTPLVLATYELTQTTHEWRFQGYKSELTYKTTEGPFKFIVPTGKLRKVKNNSWMTLSGDYKTLVVNGDTYKVRISEEEFNKLYRIFTSGNSSSTNSPTYTNNSSGSTNESNITVQKKISRPHLTNHTRDCHMCGGTGHCSYKGRPSSNTCLGSGKCNYCYGNGHLNGDTSTTWACPNCDGKYSNGLGNGLCSSCHGTGKCSYCNGTGKKSY